MRRFLGFVVLVLFGSRALAQTPAPSKPNRILGWVSTASADVGDLTNYKNRAKQYGGTLELDAGQYAKLRFDLSRDETLAKSWTGSVGPALHFGPIIFPIQAEYTQASSKWGASAGAGLQFCADVFCFEGLAKLHQGINSSGTNFLGVGTKDESHFYSLQVGAGFKF